MKKHTLKWLLILAMAASLGCEKATPIPVANETAVTATANSGNTTSSTTTASSTSTATSTTQTTSPSQTTNTTTASATNNTITTTPSTTTAAQTPVSATVTFKQQTEGQTAHNLNKVLGTIKQYLAYVPAGYNSQPNTKWPVVVFLHGSAESGNDINSIFWTYFAWKTMDKKYPYILITPQLLAGSGQWSAADLDKMLDEALSNYNIDASRIVITGYSLGAHGVWDWAELNPDRFAGAVPVSGWGDKSKASSLVNLPIWAFHGDADNSVNVNGTLDMINAIKAAGGTKASATIYAGRGHDVHSTTYDNADVISWMLVRKK